MNIAPEELETMDAEMLKEKYQEAQVLVHAHVLFPEKLFGGL